MKEVKWTGSKGNELRITIEYTSTIVKEEDINLDGHLISRNKNEVNIKGNMILYVDGKKVASCWNTSFWQIIDAGKEGYFRVWGLEQVAFTESIKTMLEAAIAEAIKEGTPVEVAEFETASNNKKIEAEKEKAKKTVEKAEKQEFIPTLEEYKVWRKKYNDLHNEGGEGYIPELITRGEYEEALMLIKTI